MVSAEKILLKTMHERVPRHCLPNFARDDAKLNHSGELQVFNFNSKARFQHALA